MPPLEATQRHNWCHKTEKLRLLRDLRNWWANHFRWVDVYHIRSRSLLTITTNSGTNFLLLHRISPTGMFVNEGKSKKGGQVEEVEDGYLFNYHFGTAAYVWTGNPISRLPAILELWATCPVTSGVYYLRFHGCIACFCYPIILLVIFLIAKICKKLNICLLVLKNVTWNCEIIDNIDMIKLDWKTTGDIRAN